MTLHPHNNDQSNTDSNDEISLCESCHCMTHTINGHCGKCRAVKINDSNAKTLSACCHAPVIVGGDDEEGTHYYVCTKCKDVCDVGVLDHIYGVKTYTQNVKIAVSTKSNVQKMQIANSNAKAGSEVSDINVPKLAGSEEELNSILLQFIAEYHQSLNELAGHGSAVDQAKKALFSWRGKAIAKSSAQAEMRGRISELESLSSFLQADIQRSLKENGLSVYPEDTYPYKEEIEERLDQLRAQGGENK